MLPSKPHRTLQDERQARFRRNPHPLAFGQNFRAGARRGTGTQADCGPFAAAGDGADDRTQQCRATGHFRGASTARGTLFRYRLRVYIDHSSIQFDAHQVEGEDGPSRELSGLLVVHQLHDDVGSSLTQIAIMSEVARRQGVDERVGEYLADRELSIGDYVLSGGEIGAAVIVDAVTRLIPGAVGNAASTQQESFTAAELSFGDGPNSTCGSGGLLDYPHYTRPADFRGMKVPEVLVSGNHEEIRRWRRRSALEKTARNRADLLEKIGLREEDQNLLAQITGKRNAEGTRS